LGEKVRACSTLTARLSHILKRRYDFGELGIDGSIILKWDLEGHDHHRYRWLKIGSKNQIF
jgi:hypothetical protein